MDVFRWRITYAMAMVGDRDMPAWQCISTLPPDFRAPSVKKTNGTDRDEYTITYDSVTVSGDRL